jgi:hypothetical protein
MATIGLLARSPYSLKYRVTRFADDDAPATRTQAQMLTDAMGGALKALLARTFNAAQWANLLGNSTVTPNVLPTLAVYATSEPNGFDGVTAITAATGKLLNDDSNNVLQVDIGTTGGAAIVEVRFQQSSQA